MNALNQCVIYLFFPGLIKVLNKVDGKIIVIRNFIFMRI